MTTILKEQNHLLFRNKQHLIDVLREYRGKIFKDVVISQSLMDHLISYYLVLSVNPDNELLSSDKNEINVRTTFLRQFIILFVDNFMVTEIDADLTSEVGKGSYGKIYGIKNSSEVVKLVIKSKSNKQIHNGNVVFVSTTLLHFTIEFFTYIVWMSILRYVTELFASDPLMQNITNMENHFVDIHRPFIIPHMFYSEAQKNPFKTVYDHQKIDTFDDDDKKSIPDLDRCDHIKNLKERLIDSLTIAPANGPDNFFFAYGYVMERYNKSFQTYVSETTNKFIHADIMQKVTVILKNVWSLSHMGVNFLHRDLTPNNIMIDGGINHSLNDTSRISLKIIDFGFSFIGIRFANTDDDWRFGHFFDVTYSMILESSYDVVLFILFMIAFYKPVLVSLKVYKHFQELINYKANLHILEKGVAGPERYTIIWMYPYTASLKDKEKLVSIFHQFSYKENLLDHTYDDVRSIYRNIVRRSRRFKISRNTTDSQNTNHDAYHRDAARTNIVVNLNNNSQRSRSLETEFSDCVLEKSQDVYSYEKNNVIDEKSTTQENIIDSLNDTKNQQENNNHELSLIPRTINQLCDDVLDNQSPDTSHTLKTHLLSPGTTDSLK